MSERLSVLAAILRARAECRGEIVLALPSEVYAGTSAAMIAGLVTYSQRRGWELTDAGQVALALGVDAGLMARR